MAAHGGETSNNHLGNNFKLDKVVIDVCFRILEHARLFGYRGGQFRFISLLAIPPFEPPFTVMSGKLEYSAKASKSDPCPFNVQR